MRLWEMEKLWLVELRKCESNCKISVLKDVQIETPIVENDEIIGVVYSDKEIEKQFIMR